SRTPKQPGPWVRLPRGRRGSVRHGRLGLIMRFATLDVGGTEQACLLVSSEIWVPLNVVDPALTGDLLALVKRQWPLERVSDLETAASSIASRAHGIPLSLARYRPPFRRPAKIFGIGLNYSEHAS